MSEWLEGQPRPEYQAISDLMSISKLGTTDTCPECIRKDFHDSIVTQDFTAVMTNDCRCGGNTVTATALTLTWKSSSVGQPQPAKQHGIPLFEPGV